MPAGRPRKNRKDVLMKSAELIGWAIGGLEREISQTKERLASLNAQAARLRVRAGARGGSGPQAAAAEDAAEAKAGRKRRRGTMSAEARKRISEMMKKRWAEKRKGK
ncbi:MAG: hypothetical protein M3545_03170 [Acidobacteriota bacterium]|nr:hypothetical protein [Acidobacteriota bacterium]